MVVIGRSSQSWGEVDDDLNDKNDDDARWLNQHGDDDSCQSVHSCKVERCLLSLEVAHLKYKSSTNFEKLICIIHNSSSTW